LKSKSLEEIKKDHSNSKLYTDSEITANIWPLGLELFELWDELREGRLACSRQDLSPVQMKSQLPLIVLHDVIGEEKRLKVRVMGTEFANTIGFDGTGRFVDQIPDSDRLLDRCNWSVCNCKPLLSVGIQLIYSHRKYKVYDSLLLPLIDDKNTVNMLLTYSNFH
jgi:hypothetical protein